MRRVWGGSLCAFVMGFFLIVGPASSKWGLVLLIGREGMGVFRRGK